MKNMQPRYLDGKKPVFFRNYGVDTRSIIGIASNEKFKCSKWRNKDLRNYDQMNLGDESVIIESICSLVSVNLSFRACSITFANLL